ncbi:hypothetical protein RhiJN_06644 [Ceratobasidium sp. AG-Ba]|nr:hypothetical protein RhiJN_06644 [Ceratobasidium sp. AG-Ba]QRW07556.1 hypothetical protein RhiLY_06555 [Ceratobasidium sp. AG-Ba]
MPPLKPKSLHHRVGTHVGSAPRAQNSPTPPTHISCNILATSFDDPFGYLSRKWNDQGQYYAFQQTQDADTLVVSIPYVADNLHQLPIVATNSPDPTLQYFGAVLQPGSLNDDFGPPPNYAYLVGTVLTPPDSPAIPGANSFDNNQHIESSIWMFGGQFGQQLGAQWINRSPQWVDGVNSGYSRTPATTIMYLHDQEKLIITGDPLWVFNNLGRAEILRFICVPPVTPI